MSEEEIIRDSVTYRYNFSKAKMLFLEQSLQEISQLVKLKNPSLNLQIEKILKKSEYAGGSSSFKQSSSFGFGECNYS